ncbi:hypothetical protein TUMSATVNIG1_59420 (plasmid) [Vibrio nigripulchritudo]|uniref:Transposase n=1 Tax=Vibrio nigripulchritudo SOn1 TaxID=1238450 RepID=A0AAV2W0V1_9VIBR|nr:hypothetical protein VNTUMSATTG_58930 [Vibrio nigripulchritudo]BDU35333.1 hypothetical protein TUMSATVNIG1_59420 [Vibrio nigripulchritudo]CCO50181.1 hypothetical protein VIBNISOn1_p0017 [Vibrio nigripulchritudo SOn1]
MLENAAPVRVTRESKSPVEETPKEMLGEANSERQSWNDIRHLRKTNGHQIGISALSVCLV